MPFKIKDLMIDVVPEKSAHRLECDDCPSTGVSGGCGPTCQPASCGYTCEMPGSCPNHSCFATCGATCHPFSCGGGTCLLPTVHPCGPTLVCDRFGSLCFTPTPQPCGPSIPVCWGRVSQPCGATAIQAQAPNRLQELARLKEQLRQALARVEAEEKEAAEAALPRTREEAEALEHKLAEALKEVRELKGKLPHREG